MPPSDTFLGEVRIARVQLARHDRLHVIRGHLRCARLVVPRFGVDEPELDSVPRRPLETFLSKRAPHIGSRPRTSRLSIHDQKDAPMSGKPASRTHLMFLNVLRYQSTRSASTIRSPTCSFASLITAMPFSPTIRRAGNVSYQRSFTQPIRQFAYR